MVIPGRYRHYKGQEYEVLGVARHSETEEEVVVYRALYGECGLWVRPLGMFQQQVDKIHALGMFLPAVEWAFIFLPMLFHAAVGFVIIANGAPNVGSYAYVGNVRYTLQRATGMIAFAFIIWHVIQRHGNLDNEIVVLRRNLDFACPEIDDRMVGAMMSELQLIGLQSEG